LLCGVL